MEVSAQKDAFPLDILPVVLKYVDLPEVMRSLARLSRGSRELILAENYILYKHFLHTFTLSDRLKRADIPAKCDIIHLIKENVTIRASQSQVDLNPFCFYTDGGTYQDETHYFIQNIFQQTNVCYSTKIPKNANVQAYLGRAINAPPQKVPPKSHKVKNEAN